MLTADNAASFVRKEIKKVAEERLSDGVLTVEDLKGSPLDSSPFGYDTFVDEESLMSLSYRTSNQNVQV